MNNLQGAIDTNAILSNLGDIKASVPLTGSQIQLAIAGAQADITGQSMQQTIALQQQGFNGQLANLAGFASTKDAVDSLSTQVAIGQGVTNTNIERLGWQVTQAVQCDGDKTRALINSIERDNLLARNTALANEVIELRNEGRRRDDRHGVEVTMINNQNQNQLQFQQQAQILGTLTSALVDVSQIARATNQAINIGSGIQAANPTNSATNVKA